MILYTVGFAFSLNKETVVLIKKNKPEWQSGKLNGVGGKVEGSEKTIDCMIREFQEEAGIYVPDWDHFATLTDESEYTVYMYRTLLSYARIDQCKTMTDEEIILCYIKDLDLSRGIKNLQWVLPLALSDDEDLPLYMIKNIYEDMEM